MAAATTASKQFANDEKIVLVVEDLTERDLELFPFGANHVHPLLDCSGPSVNPVDSWKGAGRAPFHVGVVSCATSDTSPRLKAS